VTQSGLRALERALLASQQAGQSRAGDRGRQRAPSRSGAGRTGRALFRGTRSRARFRSLRRLATVVVAFGSQVTILRHDDRRQTFRIVGEDEADPCGGSIAYVSPLAHRLIGKRVGEAVEMDGREIEVVAVE